MSTFIPIPGNTGVETPAFCVVLESKEYASQRAEVFFPASDVIGRQPQILQHTLSLWPVIESSDINAVQHCPVVIPRYLHFKL